MLLIRLDIFWPLHVGVGNGRPQNLKIRSSSKAATVDATETCRNNLPFLNNVKFEIIELINLQWISDNYSLDINKFSNLWHMRNESRPSRAGPPEPCQAARSFSPWGTATCSGITCSWYPKLVTVLKRRKYLVHHHVVPWLFPWSLALSYCIHVSTYKHRHTHKHTKIWCIYIHIYIYYDMIYIYIYTYISVCARVSLWFSQYILIESHEIPFRQAWAGRAHDFVVEEVPSPGAERVAKPTARASRWGHGVQIRSNKRISGGFIHQE